MIKELFFILLSAFATADLHSITLGDLRNSSETDPAPRDPCSPSPCEPNSQCHVISGQSEYRCLPSDTLTPPEYGPHCTRSSECSSNRACINQNCTDPCPGICGLNAICETMNHIPTCTCKTGFAGAPYVGCFEMTKLGPRLKRLSYASPCFPSPCGPNAKCTNMNGEPSCACLSGFIGLPPNCRPECIINGECPSNLVCSAFTCQDPCIGTCGIDANCSVIDHVPICVCPENLTGDPYVRCSSLPSSSPAPPGCALDSDCPRDRVCIGSKCQDLCPRACGQNAVCNIDNHRAICTSPPGILGNIFLNYFLIQVPDKTDPCKPSPCGLNSQCRRINEQTVCSCMPGYFGAPPNCRSECTSNTDCAASMTCINQKCLDPCPDSCGARAQCHVDNHQPVCSCSPGLTGNPFVHCYPFLADPTPEDPCRPSPCAPNAECSVVNGNASCTCLPNFTGNPYEECSLFPPPPIPYQVAGCNPSSCGPYSRCTSIDGQTTCSCMPGYSGAPPNCRPECVINAECPSSMTCIAQKCYDPCPGSCGAGAQCHVQKHQPFCGCLSGLTGNPFVKCTPICKYYDE